MSSTVVIGAGIIGLSTAYYLSDHQPPSTVHLVESSPELFASASGYAGGFLAKDWFAPPLLSLGALSFELHQKLAETYSGREKWHYSPTTSVHYAPSRQNGGQQQRGDDWLRQGTSRVQAAPTEPEVTTEGNADSPAPPWLRRLPGDHVELTSAEGTTAQLDPLRLCRFLLDECIKRGVRLHHPATVASVSADLLRGELSSVRIVDAGLRAETDLPCTRIIIAAGAWSGRVFKSLFRHSRLDIPVASLAGHSLVVRSPRWTGGEGETCHAVYTTHGKGFSPEIFARAGGEIYVAGLNSAAIPLPEATGKAAVMGHAMESVKETAQMLLGRDGEGNDLQVVREGLCFRPVTPWGLPIIARIADEHLGPGMATRPGADGGVFVVTGHGPWGIALSLGTGCVVAELAQGRSPSADVSGLGLKAR